jgi:hypothetical protein
MPSTPRVKLSDAIGAPIVSAYKAGGLGLAFLTLGASLLLAAFRWNDKGVFTYFILGVGTLLIFSTLTLFYFKDLKKLMNAHKGIQQNAELIDTIQQTALEMTELAAARSSILSGFSLEQTSGGPRHSIFSGFARILLPGGPFLEAPLQLQRKSGLLSQNAASAIPAML